MFCSIPPVTYGGFSNCVSRRRMFDYTDGCLSERRAEDQRRGREGRLDILRSVKRAERREELIQASCRRSSCCPLTSGCSRATLGPAGQGSGEATQPLWRGGKRRPASSTLLMFTNYTYQSSEDAMCNYQLSLSAA